MSGIFDLLILVNYVISTKLNQRLVLFKIVLFGKFHEAMCFWMIFEIQCMIDCSFLYRF